MTPAGLFSKTDDRLSQAIAEVMGAVDDLFPIPSRHRDELPRDIRDLSASLTADRAERGGSYLGKPGAHSAYLRYFLPWNLYRLGRLLPSLPLDLKDGDAVVDLGSGPLTFVIALWIARPELRTLSLEFRCVDQTGLVLDAGETLFSALGSLAGESSQGAWRVRKIRGDLDCRIDGPKAALSVAANVLNELFWKDRSPLRVQAARHAGRLASLTRDGGQILVVEPGIPRSGEFVAALRGSFLDQGRALLSPCPHGAPCPMPGGRGSKWCHFALDTDDAPRQLKELSKAAHLPKERATLSFLLAGKSGGARHAPAGAELRGGAIPVRVVSDSFALPSLRASGRYGCSAEGLVLVQGARDPIDALSSGDLLLEGLDPSAKDGGAWRRDEKSGAIILRLEGGSPGAPEARHPPAKAPSRSTALGPAAPGGLRKGLGKPRADRPTGGRRPASSKKGQPPSKPRKR